MSSERVPETSLTEAISLTQRFLQLRNNKREISPREAADELTSQILDLKIAELRQRRMISNTLNRLVNRVKNL